MSSHVHENNCNHILLPYSYSLYEPKSHALMQYNVGLEKAILRDSELLSEVNDAFCKSHPLLAQKVVTVCLLRDNVVTNLTQRCFQKQAHK